MDECHGAAGLGRLCHGGPVAVVEEALLPPLSLVVASPIDVPN